MATTQNKKSANGAATATAAVAPKKANALVKTGGAKVPTAPVPAPAVAGAAQKGGGGRRWGGLRFGLLPVTIFAAVLLLGVRVVDVWSLIASRNGAVPDIPVSEAKDATPATPIGTAPVGAAPVGTAVTGPNRPAAQPGGRMQVADNAPAKEPASAGKEGAGKEAAAKEGDNKEGSGAAGALSPIDNEQLLKHYADRREELDKKAKDVSMREALLTAAESRIDQKLKELEKVKNQIQGLMKTGDDRQSQQVESLVKIYETMKPKDAARIFEELDMPVLMEVVQKMKEAKVAPILAAMDPAKAKVVTAALLDRHALPAAAAGQ